MILYIKRGCPWCVEASAWLRQHGYEFTEIDVLSDRPAYERMIKISGQSLAPTLETPAGDVLPDFDVRQLEKFLLTHKIHA